MIDGVFTTAVRLFTGARGRWVNCAPESTAPRVYFSNHTSHLDFVVLWAVLPPAERRKTRPAAARDYWSGSGLRRWLAERVFRAALIERANVTRANNPVEQLAAVLAGGDSIIIFPEGTRTTGPEMGPFKSGLFHLAKRQPEAELVPAYIENLNRVLPKGEILAIPVICKVTFGAPLRVAENETKEAFLARARDAVTQLKAI
jgi:1-acyl-sn-glycerol-3-phosphate acyltransferase